MTRTFGDFNTEFARQQLSYGPWSPSCVEPERGKQLRCLAGQVATAFGSAHPAIAKLRAAEDGSPEALATALSAIEALPAWTRRKLLSTFQAVTWPV